jgi:hypothetical protein
MADKLSDAIESAALHAQTSDDRGGNRYLTFSETVQASQAISLKRIADALTEPCNAYGENFATAIQGAIVRGMRDIAP